jgi:Flp pilus assembly protein TadB
MSLPKFLARTAAVALLCLALIASLGMLIGPPWNSPVSVLLGALVGMWVFRQIDEYRWLQWFLSVKKVPR